MSKPTNATPKPLSDEDLARGLEALLGFETTPSGKLCLRESAKRIRSQSLALKAKPAPVPCTCYSQDSKENEAWLATSEDPNEPHRLECPAPVPTTLCPVCGSGFIVRQSGPLPGCPQGILTSVCATDPSHASEHSVKPTASVPLAEDEALIAELLKPCCGSCCTNPCPLHEKSSERLSLRSGQLAQVLALCDDAESTKQAKECIAGGGVICIQVPEIRAAIEGKN